MVLKLHRNVKIIHKEQIVITYKLLSEHKQDPELGEYDACGIIVKRAGTVIRVIEDISTDRERLVRLIDVFNREKLSPAQLDEAVENFLYDFEV